MIERQTATVYFAPTANRRFLTKRAAINKEARAIILKHFPSERPVYDFPEYDPGWSLEVEQPERFARYHRMLCKVLSSRIQ